MPPTWETEKKKKKSIHAIPIAVDEIKSNFWCSNNMKNTHWTSTRRKGLERAFGRQRCGSSTDSWAKCLDDALVRDYTLPLRDYILQFYATRSRSASWCKTLFGWMNGRRWKKNTRNHLNWTCESYIIQCAIESEQYVEPNLIYKNKPCTSAVFMCKSEPLTPWRCTKRFFFSCRFFVSVLPSSELSVFVVIFFFL